MKRIFAIFALLCAAVIGVFAQGQPLEFKPEVRRIAVFKNGYAFTYREAETRTNGGWAYTTNAPIGVLGTVWGYTSSPNTRVTQILASESEKRESERAINIAEILLANEGARIRFVENYNSKPFEGTYEIVSRHRNFTAPQPREGTGIEYREDAVIIALKTESGVMLFNASAIRNIEFLSSPKMEKFKTSKENRLALKVDGTRDGENISLGIAALERGIRWIPAYRIEVKGAPIKEAKLELEAMLINELTDLKDTEINFVVGVPNFLFQDTMSPLSMNTAFAGVSSYFAAGAGASRRDTYSNAIMTQRMYSDDASSQMDGLPTISDEEQTASFSAEQLYLYQAKQISLKKGERASLRLFSLTIPCTEVFEWTISDEPRAASLYLSPSSSAVIPPPTTDLTNRIWYALRMKNTTGMPWTTAPALSFRDWKPLGQDMLTFTPIGGENILRVTPATEVIGTHKLEEKGRERQRIPYAGSTYDFDLVTVEGTVKLRNIKKEPVEVVLTRNLVGEVVSATDKGAISREGLNLQAVNPNSIVKWNLTLPGGEKEIRYTYKVYVRK
jgi:hypothetical protein